MVRPLKTTFTALTVAVGLLVVGCQSSSKPSPNAMAGTPSDDAIACDKCNVTWVKSPREHRGRVVGYSNRKQMVCPECKSAVQNLFATGKLEHTCTACGGNMSGCAVH